MPGFHRPVTDIMHHIMRFSDEKNPNVMPGNCGGLSPQTDPTPVRPTM